MVPWASKEKIWVNLSDTIYLIPSQVFAPVCVPMPMCSQGSVCQGSHLHLPASLVLKWTFRPLLVGGGTVCPQLSVVCLSWVWLGLTVGLARRGDFRSKANSRWGYRKRLYVVLKENTTRCQEAGVDECWPDSVAQWWRTCKPSNRTSFFGHRHWVVTVTRLFWMTRHLKGCRE